MTEVPPAQGFFLERLAIATLLGLAIGLERQWRQRAAGLHTSTLVAVGAALFMAIPQLRLRAALASVAGDASVSYDMAEHST
jgi:uncharacterized membrane protein YhiD involved in acid resistance